MLIGVTSGLCWAKCHCMELSIYGGALTCSIVHAKQQHCCTQIE